MLANSNEPFNREACLYCLQSVSTRQSERRPKKSDLNGLKNLCRVILDVVRSHRAAGQIREVILRRPQCQTVLHVNKTMNIDSKDW